jgi:hypothetical protein
MLHLMPAGPAGRLSPGAFWDVKGYAGPVGVRGKGEGGVLTTMAEYVSLLYWRHFGGERR